MRGRCSGKTLPPRMRLALSIRPAWQRLAVGFGFHSFAGHTWLGFEQLQLQSAQSFALGARIF